MMVYLLSHIFLALIIPVKAEGVSAKRPTGESYQKRAFELYNETQHDTGLLSAHSTSVNAYASRQPLSKIDLNDIVEFHTQRELYELFTDIRDNRLLEDNQHYGFKRRLSWLYPDDGCFLRADLMNYMMEKKSLEKFSQIFIFGNLKVETQNSPSGYVSWWYHVAPITKVGDSYYVIDPAINHYEPTELNEWVQRQVEDKTDAQLSLCNSDVTSPFDGGCKLVPNYRRLYDSTMSSMQSYLNDEWRRQESLGRDPFRVLGEFPIWEDENIPPTSIRL